MPRPRTPEQALRLGLAALTLLLGACQQLPDARPASEAAAPEPVIVAPEPVIEAPVAVAPSPRRPATPAPAPARPRAPGIVVGGATQSGQITAGNANAAITPSTSATIGQSAQGDAATTSAEIQVASGDPAPAPIPQFPWPPPRASASAVIPAAFVKPGGVDTATLGDVADEISAALDTGGYFERSYFGAPGGFAMVTRLERINPDGTPTDEAERWTVGALPLTSFSLAAYLRALFTAPSGHYRIIVFVVSSQPFAQSETEVQRDEALAWLSDGLNRLPDNMALAPFTPQHTVTALIYEFEQPGNQEAMLMLPAHLMGRVHLQRAQLWDALRQ